MRNESICSCSEYLYVDKNTQINRKTLNFAYCLQELIEYIESLERALNFTKLQQLEMFDSYKATIETLLSLSQTKQEDDHVSLTMMKNLTQNLSSLKQRFENFSHEMSTNTSLDILNSIKKTYELVMENSKYLKKIHNVTYSKNNETQEGIKKLGKSISKNINVTKSDDFTDIDSLIQEIFFVNKTEMISSTTEGPCLDVDIDVRFNNGDDSYTENPVRCKNGNKYQ